MHSLTDLRSKILPLPSLFAQNADAKTSQESMIVPSAENMNFPTGFPQAYSHAPNDGGGKYLQRNDFNFLGDLASRESHYREAGGIHTFSAKVSEDFEGYPQGAVLGAYDGMMLTKVESTESNNTKPFLDNDGKIIPNVIDCKVNKPEEQDNSVPPRVLWKTVSWAYGTQEGIYSLNLDYTRTQKLNAGDYIAADSIVIGEKVVLSIIEGNVTVDKMLPISHVTNIATGTENYTLPMDGRPYITNKGKDGDAVSYIVIYTLKKGHVVLNKCPVVVVTGGSGNYHLSFFAKAGTTFSGEMHCFNKRGQDILKGDTSITWTAIPIVPVVTPKEEE